MTESTSAIEQAVAARIAAARRRTEDMRRQRAELAAARKRGLAARHAQKLRNQASQQQEASIRTTDGTGVSVSPTETGAPNDLRGAESHAGMGQSPTVAAPSDGVTGNRGDMTTDDEEQA